MKPSSFVSIEVHPVADIRRAGWPVPEESGLARFRTVAFDVAMMRQAITFNGATGTVELGLWIECVVPECYRERVRDIVPDAFGYLRNMKWKGNESVDCLIVQLRCEIWGRIEPIWPGDVPDPALS